MDRELLLLVFLEVIYCFLLIHLRQQRKEQRRTLEKERSLDFEQCPDASLDEGSETPSSFTETDALHNFINPGFYEPPYREDGNPLEDEQKLRSFTGQLPGWEGGRRVAVALHSVNTGSRNRELDVNSSLLPRTPLGSETRTDLPFRELRATTSDLEFRKPKWDKSRKPRGLHLSHPLQVQTTDDQLFQRDFIADTTMYYPKSSSSSNATTNSFGAVGDGRYSVSKSQLPASSDLITQPAYSLEQLHSLRKGSQAYAAESPGTNSLIKSSLHNESLPKNGFADNAGSMGIRSPFIGMNKRPQRRRSFSNSNTSTPKDAISVISRRVSRPVAPTKEVYEAHFENERIQQLAAKRQHSTETETVHPRAPLIWKREGSTFRSKISAADQHLFIPESRFDPESFALPYGVS